MGKQGLNMAGAPSAFYYSESSTVFDMDIAIPVDKPGKADGQVKPGEVKAGKVAMVRFYGPYEKPATDMPPFMPTSAPTTSRSPALPGSRT